MNKQLNIEEIINENIDVSKLGLELVGKEYSTPLGRIDILCKDDIGMYVPIEVKVGTASDSAIGQILRYMHTMKSESGIIMANDFTEGVRSIYEKLNIILIPYTIDVIIGNKSVAYSGIENNIDSSVKCCNEIYPDTYTWLCNNIDITGHVNNRIAICDINNEVLKYVDEMKWLPKKDQFITIRNLLNFDGAVNDPKLTCKNIDGKQNIAIGGITWRT